MLPSDRFGVSLPRPGLRRGRDRLPSWVGPFASALAFWSAIALPVCYLSLLVVGIEDASGLALFLALFGLHVLTLIVGRSHRLDSSR